MSVKVFLGIGSNLGNRKAHCLEALRRLETLGVKIIRVSCLLETEPWGVEEQPAFINMAAEAETSLEPMELLRVIKSLEADMGRDMDAERWGPRLIDVDILFYASDILDEPELTVPHPLIQERTFVLSPMAEIAPDFMHPILKKTISQLLAKIV